MSESDDEFPIQENDIKYIKKLGEGSFSEVFLVEIYGNFYTLKKLFKEFSEKNKILIRIWNEPLILRKLGNHPNIVLMYCYTEDCVILEYIEGSDFYSLICENKKLDIKIIKKILKELCYAIQHAHSLNIAHFDIKPENIIVSPDFSVVKLIDWGLSEDINNLKKTYRMKGSLPYIAPELIHDNIDYYAGLENDIWSLGVTIFSSVFYEFPFAGEENREKLIQNICNFDVNYSIIKDLKLKKLLEKIFVPWFSRPTINDIILGQWFLE